MKNDMSRYVDFRVRNFKTNESTLTERITQEYTWSRALSELGVPIRQYPRVAETSKGSQLPVVGRCLKHNLKWR